jgi:hypothetical protein
LNEEPQDAELERLLDILFPHKFSTIEEEIDNITVFNADSKYKTDQWKENHRNEMMYLLLQSFRELKLQNYTFIIPKSVKDRTNEYLNKSFPLLEMFEKYYKPTEEKNIFVKVKEVIEKIQYSQEYQLFSKKEQRKYNQKYIIDFFINHPKFKRNYYERKRINDIDYRSIIMGYIENIE